MTCRWGNRWESSGEGIEVIAVIAEQMGVAESGRQGEKSEGIWWTGGEWQLRNLRSRGGNMNPDCDRCWILIYITQRIQRAESCIGL